MAIGTGWADGAWVDAGWVAEAWDDVPYVEPEIVTGGVRKVRHLKKMPRNFFPWESENDDFIEEAIEDLKRPTLKIVKRAPKPDFDSTLDSERMNLEIIKELKRVEKIRKKKAQRRKAIEMLLLS